MTAAQTGRKRRRNYASDSDDEPAAGSNAPDDDGGDNAMDETASSAPPVVDPSQYEVLGSDTFQRLSKIDLLPSWMADGARVSNDIAGASVAIKHWPHKRLMDKTLRETLKTNGIKSLYPIQAAALPLLLDDDGEHAQSDVCIAAPTGSGKTLVYTIPLVELARRPSTGGIVGIVLLPTQTLANQVHAVIQTYMPPRRTCALLTPVNGIDAERARLWTKDTRHKNTSNCDGAHILVTTVARLIEHMYYVDPATFFGESSSRPPSLDLSHLRLLVVDEADRLMHDTRFDWAHEIDRCRHLSMARRPRDGGDLPALRKILVSATLSHDTQLLAQFRLHRPMLVRACADVDTSSSATPRDMTAVAEPITNIDVALPSTLSHAYLVCAEQTKPLTLYALLKRHAVEWSTVLVFVQSREDASRLGPLLTALIAADASTDDYRVETYHGNMFGGHRAKIIKRFASGVTRVLVASDLVARGLDVPNVSVVVNYSPCTQRVNYTHRAGRCARQGLDGTVLTLLHKEETRPFDAFMRANKWTNVEKVDMSDKVVRELMPVYRLALAKVKGAAIEKGKNNGRKRK